jgi:hypothetical protein
MSMHTQRKSLNQDVTAWAVTPDGWGGDEFGTPQLIKGRWEDTNEVFQNRTREERELVSKAVVFLDTQLKVGDILYLGDMSSLANPSNLEGAFKIQLFEKVTDLRSATSVNMAVL